LARAQFPARLDSDGGLFEAGIASATIDGYARSSLSDLAASLWGVRSRLSGIGSASVTRFGSGNVAAYGELHGAAALSTLAHVEHLVEQGKVATDGDITLESEYFPV